MGWDREYNVEAEQEGLTPEELVDTWIADTIASYDRLRVIPFTGPLNTRPGVLEIRGNRERGLDIFRKFILFLYANGHRFYVEKEREHYSSARYQDVRSIAYIYGEDFPVRLVEKKIPKAQLLKERDKPHPLQFQMEIFPWFTKQKTFYETKSLNLEDRFEEILEWLKQEAQENIKWKENQKRHEEELARQKKEKEEHEAMIMERAGYAYSIRNAIKRIEKATTIRQFCERLKKEEISHKGSISEMTLTKIEVALSLADWIDPFVEHVDEILAEKYKPEDFL